MADSILSLSNVESSYGPVTAVRGVTLDVERGSIVALLGANGAGKTTILKTISGILEASRGTITFEGRPIHNMEPDRIVRLGLAHVPEGREVFPDLSVRDNLMMGAFLRRDRKAILDDIDRVFDYMPQLRPLAARAAGSMSGGEQQMLALGRALMSRPRLLLLDEPSLGLSPRLIKEIFEVISSISRREGLSILLVEQNANMALAAASYCYVLDVGRIVAQDGAENFRTNSNIAHLYLSGDGDEDELYE